MKSLAVLIGLAVAAHAYAQQCAVPVPCQNDFNAYEMKEAISGSANVCTPYACGNVVIERTRRLFVPIETSGLPASDLHYLGYEVLSDTYDESANPSSVTFQTLYGSTTQNMKKPIALLVVPAGKTIPPAPPPALPSTTDGYLCFKPSSTNFGMSKVTVDDQFGTQTYTIHRVAYTCVSAGINAAAPGTTSWLLGIAGKDTTLKFPPDASIIDIFHPGGRVIQVDPIDELVAIATIAP